MGSFYPFATNSKFPDPLKGLHVGRVVSNSDPKKMGRLKCYIYDLIESDDDSKLPWVYQKKSFLGSNFSEVSQVPDVDSLVLIEFPFDSVYAPVYESSFQIPLKSDLKTNYPNRVGSFIVGGYITYYDKSTKEFVIKHPSGHTVKMTESGIFISSEGTMSLSSKGNMTISTNGKLTVNSSTREDTVSGLYLMKGNPISSNP